MSRRDERATITALQPRSPELRRRHEPKRLTPEEAAGGMAYSALEAGSDLRERMLRLKADPDDQATFKAVLERLLERHGFRPKKPVPMLYAVVTVALFEWTRDRCPKCRAGDDRRGMVCRTCQNTGRLAFDTRTRKKLVEDLWSSIARGQEFPLTSWRQVWIRRYTAILMDLRREE